MSCILFQHLEDSYSRKYCCTSSSLARSTMTKNNIAPPIGVVASFVLFLNTPSNAISHHLLSISKVIEIESPSSPDLTLIDLPGIVRCVRATL